MMIVLMNLSQSARRPYRPSGRAFSTHLHVEMALSDFRVAVHCCRVLRENLLHICIWLQSVTRLLTQWYFSSILFWSDGSGTDRISLLIFFCSSSCSCSGERRPKKPKGSVDSIRIGMKFVRNILQLNTHRLMESDFRFDVISRREVLPFDEFTRSVFSSHMQQRPTFAVVKFITMLFYKWLSFVSVVSTCHFLADRTACSCAYLFVGGAAWVIGAPGRTAI